MTAGNISGHRRGFRGRSLFLLAAFSVVFLGICLEQAADAAGADGSHGTGTGVRRFLEKRQYLRNDSNQAFQCSYLWTIPLGDPCDEQLELDHAYYEVKLIDLLHKHGLSSENDATPSYVRDAAQLHCIGKPLTTSCHNNTCSCPCFDDGDAEINETETECRRLFGHLDERSGSAPTIVAATTPTTRFQLILLAAAFTAIYFHFVAVSGGRRQIHDRVEVVSAGEDEDDND